MNKRNFWNINKEYESKLSNKNYISSCTVSVELDNEP